jgi:hypothetical protein
MWHYPASRLPAWREMRPGRLIIAFLVLACAFFACQGLAAAPGTPLAHLLARAEALSASGQIHRAYELLARAEDIHIGEIEFDYALGRAALAARRPDHATLAFSRVLALDPRHGGALIDTGRAYLALGNFAQARAAFEALLSFDPPAPVRAQLLEYLELARRGRRDEAARLSLQGYLAATLGRSSNVNQSPGQAQVFVPGFGASFQLSEQNVRKPDRYWSLAGGLDLALPIGRGYSLIGGVELLERRNQREAAFDLGSAGGRLGFAAGGERDLLRVQLIAGRTYLGHSPNRDLAALSVEEHYALRADTRLVAYAQAGRLRHPPEELRIFDADFLTAGLGGSKQIGQSTTLFAGFAAGKENDIGGNPNGDKRHVGLRLAAEIEVLPRTKLIATAAPQRAQYDRFDPAFLAERRDDRREYEAVLQYSLDGRLVLRAGVAYTVQRSNIPIFEFSRTDYWVTLRRDF